jgi:ABC-type multidrug transport system ATPase subunit
MTAPAVEAREVSRRYRGGRGVGPVDLCVDAGEVLVLMGPNGAGKTTLLRLLATVDRPQHGAVRWHGGDAATARRSIGLALDSAVEEATLSGLQATHFWCRQWIADSGRAQRLCEDALRRFGLWEVRDEPVGTYSYGMRRRLALAQALAHDPRLALLDEPTAGLDPAGVQALVTELHRRAASGLTSVVASNDPNFAAAAAHRVAFVSRGFVVHCATPAELLARVGAARVAELVATASDLNALAAVRGVERVDPRPDGCAVRYHDPAALPGIVAAVDHLRELRVREPNLGDAFRELTGDQLTSTDPDFSPLLTGLTAPTPPGAAAEPPR